MSKTELYAGVSVTDITPPLEVGLLTSSVKGKYEPFEAIRTPLKARVLVLQSELERVAIVSLDLLSLSDTAVGGWEAFKQGMAGSVAAEKIILCCTHTHNAPESGALTDLYKTIAFKSWLMDVQFRIKEAITMAVSRIQSCTLSYASSVLEGYSLQRRIRGAGGIIMSDALQPVSDAMMEGKPVDRRVKSIRLTGQDQQYIATLVQAVCHPVHEMCIPQVSADFPGEMCMALDQPGINGTAFFFNGAAGDTNPPTVSGGASFAKQHGMALAALVEKEKPTALPNSFFFCRHITIPFTIRPGSGISNTGDAIARISALHFGTLALLFLPGEIFIEIALEIEKRSPFEQTVIVGFSENSIGYVPTATAFDEGGYETGPGRWSFLEKDAARQLVEKSVALLHALFHKKYLISSDT